MVSRNRAIVGVVLSTLGCAAPGMAIGRALPTVRIGCQPNLGGSRFFVALAGGIFARNGIDARPVWFSVGSKYFAAFDSGNIDAGWLGTPPVSTGIAEGVPMRVFAVESLAKDQEGLVVRPGSGIRSVRDLRGKRIATKRGSTGDVALQTALRKADLAAIDVDLVDLDVEQLLAAYKAGKIDGGWYWEPWQGLLREAGGVQIETDRSCGIFVGWTWAGRPAWLERNPEIVQALLRSLDDAASFMRARPQEAARLCARAVGIAPALALRVIAHEGEWPTMAETWNPAYALSMNPRALEAGRGAARALRVNVAQAAESTAGRVAAALDAAPLAAYLRRRA